MTNKLSRRRFLAGSAAAAAAASAAAVGGPLAIRALGASGKGRGERLAPPGKLGVQQFSIRDATLRRSIASSVAAGIAPTRGYLGGPNFPEDPTDLGPQVDLPGGYIEVFEYLASVGYKGFEFFQFTQNVNELGRQPTIPEIRSYLDGAGLSGFGTHTASLGTMYSATTDSLSANGQIQIDNAHILGLPMIGTAGDPTNSQVLATVGNTIGWTEAARRANIVGQAAADAGLKWYWHVEQNGFQGFNATIHPELVGQNRMQWFYAHTDPDLVFIEPDIFHSYSGRARFPFPGFTVADRYNPAYLFDWFGWQKANYHRNVAWHIKDGTRVAVLPDPPGNPFTQTVARAGFPLGMTDALYEGEGSIARGYPVDPDPAVVGFVRLFDEVGAKGSRFYIVESDSAIGGAADPGRSLRHAKLGAAYMLGLRAGPKTKSVGVSSDEATVSGAA